MPNWNKRTTKKGFSADGQTKDQLGMELRQHRCALFIQQFEKEAQERLNEMEDKMENMLATVDKFFQVELMKMPPSLQNTRLGDLLGEEISASEVSVAIKNDSPDIHQPLKRPPSKKVRLSADSPSQITQAHKPPVKTSKGGKGTKKSRTLVGSNSTGNLRCSTTLTVKRTQSRLAKTSDEATLTKPKLRSVASTGNLSCSVTGSAPQITITTSRGQICLSEETKDDINLNLLDEVALHQMQRLMRLIDYLSSKAKVGGNNE